LHLDILFQMGAIESIRVWQLGEDWYFGGISCLALEKKDQKSACFLKLSLASAGTIPYKLCEEVVEFDSPQKSASARIA
jgi:hypothetical protein